MAQRVLSNSCEEFCIGYHVTQYETGLLLELHGSHVGYKFDFLLMKKFLVQQIDNPV